MTDPSRDDDGWNDLYADLGIDKPAAAPKPAEPAAVSPHASDEVTVDEEPAEAWADEVPPTDAEEAGADADGGDEEGDEPGSGDEGSAEEGPPGTGRKRRRRRRRKKKAGAPDGVGAAAEAAPADAEGDDSGGEETPRYAAPRGRVSNESADDADEPTETEDAAPAGVGEGTSGDALRELVATWNVPSWDEIISGLHRPDR